MSVLITEKIQTNYNKQESFRKLCRKISFNKKYQNNQELQHNETLQMIIKSPEYVSWTDIELFKPIHNVLKDPFIKISYFRSDVLFKLMNILKYLEEKNHKFDYSNRKIIRINKLQNLL